MTEKVTTETTEEITSETEATQPQAGGTTTGTSTVTSAAELMKAAAQVDTSPEPDPPAEAMEESQFSDVPSLAKLASRLASTAPEENAEVAATAEDTDAADIRNRLAALKAHAAPDHKELRHEDRVDTFQSVEDALQKLSNEIDSENAAAAQAQEIKAPQPPQTWNDDAAEELTSHCEIAGLSAAPGKDDLLIGDDGVKGPDAPTGYVYLQPNAQEIGQQWFEDRFEELAQRFDGGASIGGGQDLATLLEKLDSLEARVETAINGNASASSMHDIELCIAEIATQLESTTSQLSRIESLESQISKVAKDIAAPRNTISANGTSTLDMTALADLVADRIATNPVAPGSVSGDPAVSGDVAGIGEGNFQPWEALGDPSLSRGERGFSEGVGNDNVFFFNTGGDNPLFVEPESGSFATSQQRNEFIRDPGFFDANLGIFKMFQITERQGLEFRAEMFNVFNHPNKGAVNRNPVSSAFGRVTSKGGERDIQLSLKYRF